MPHRKNAGYNRRQAKGFALPVTLAAELGAKQWPHFLPPSGFDLSPCCGASLLSIRIKELARQGVARRRAEFNFQTSNEADPRLSC
jgi:hypothetical protein